MDASHWQVVSRRQPTPAQLADLAFAWRVGRFIKSNAIVYVHDRATVGVGVKGGAEACLAAADVFLSTPGLAPLVALTQGATRTLGIIRLGIMISILYNLLGVVLAFQGLINPLVAAVMMPTSSITVVWIAWRGRTFEEARP